MSVIYSALSELNLQLSEGEKVEQSLSTVLFGAGGRLDSLALAMIVEGKLKTAFEFQFDHTQDDPFSSGTGHWQFRWRSAKRCCPWYYRKTVPWVGHVKVGNEHVKALGSDSSQSFCHAVGTNYVKSLAFKALRHHGANRSVIVYQQTLWAAVGSVGVIRHHLPDTNGSSLDTRFSRN